MASAPAGSGLRARVRARSGDGGESAAAEVALDDGPREIVGLVRKNRHRDGFALQLAEQVVDAGIRACLSIPRAP
jgi:hypothetical protein